jgi:small conductance mechanosensitive channel
MKEFFNTHSDKFIIQAQSFAGNIGLALFTLFVGWWVTNKLNALIGRGLDKAIPDKDIKPFSIRIINVLMKTVVIVSALDVLGVETTSFMAVLGAAGLAIGLSLKDNLSNFAAGILILIFKPFRVGHTIQASGETGEVQQISIFQTYLRTFDYKMIIIPNGKVFNENIVNFSASDIRRVDINFGISYSDNIDVARKALLKIADDDIRVLSDPAPQVVVSGLLDSAVELRLRSWVNNEDYWSVYFSFLEQGKLALEKEGITIPFPQRDVHIHPQAPQ